MSNSQKVIPNKNLHNFEVIKAVYHRLPANKKTFNQLVVDLDYIEKLKIKNTDKDYLPTETHLFERFLVLRKFLQLIK